MHIKNQKDFWAGVMFVGFGAFFAGFGAQYRLGTAASMGPGFFPTALGLILILLGVVIAVGGLAARAVPEKIERFDWSTLLLVLGPIALFGLLLPTLGLVLCLAMLVAVSSYASHEFSWKATLANAAALIALSLLVFVYALHLQFPLWPAIFGA